MVWWLFWTVFCVLWAGVHKASNARKCLFKHIQFHILENVGLKAFLDSAWNPKVWMPSQAIAKTDGLVVALDMFLCFVGWGTQSFKCTEMSVKTYSASQIRKCWLKGSFGHQRARRPKMSRNPEVWMPSQTIAKTDGSVVVLGTFLCFVGWGTQRFKCAEMSV